MIKITIISVAILLINSVVYGQYIDQRSSTYEESILRGAAALNYGSARYLEGLGHYEILREHARRERLYNRDEAFRQYKERKEYRDANKFNHLDFMEKKLNDAERRYALRQREQDLIYKGVLPPKPKTAYIINGKIYNNLDNYYGSNQHHIDKLKLAEEKTMKEIREFMEKRREYEATVRLARWDKMTPSERVEYSRRRQYSDNFVEEPIPQNKEIEREIDIRMKVLENIRKELSRLEK